MWIYIWTTGQICTQPLITHSILKPYEKELIKRRRGKQVFDDKGLVTNTFQQVGIKMATRSTSAWRGTNW